MESFGGIADSLCTVSQIFWLMRAVRLVRRAASYVVTREDGGPLQPRSLTHVMSAFLKDWGVTLHKLRHSHASHMLAANVHPKVVQERLGHSSIAITMDIYSHLMPNMQEQAAAAVDGALRAATNKLDDKG